MEPRFLDTNILLRHLTGDDEARSPQARALLLRVEEGQELVETSSMVIFETVFTLQRTFGWSRREIRDLLWPLVALPGIHLPDKATLRRAFDLYVLHNVSFADAYNVAVMEERGIGSVYSWDKDYDRFPGVTRLEPEIDEQGP